jgi:HD superfamily phosphohydrolase YqeK
MAIMTKLLQVINSPYFGLPRTITSAEEAVGLLGFDTVKSMVMAVKLLGHYDRIKTGDFSIEQLWQHSTAVAHNARRLVLLQTGNRALAEEAFAAGLMHDVGKAVLAGNFAEQYHGAQSLARKQQIPLWEVEKEIFGANHGEIGAYLLSLWGLPLNILEAAALHHYPIRTASKGFNALTAVHVANVLEYEAAAIRPEGEVFPLIDTEYLTEIGLVASVQTWREEILGPALTENQGAPDGSESAPTNAETELLYTPASPALVVQSEGTGPNTEPARHGGEGAVEPVQVCAASEGVADSGANRPSMENATAPLPVPQPTDLIPHCPQAFKGAALGLYATAAALLILLIAGPVIRSHLQSKQAPVIIRAHEINPSPTNGLTETSGSAPAPAPDASGDAGELADLDDQIGAESNAVPASARSADPLVPPASVAAPAQLPATPKEPQFPQVKLQGILFSPGKPSAIINGELVHPNDRISGARVVEIKANTVVLEFQNQRRSLSLE